MSSLSGFKAFKNLVESKTDSDKCIKPLLDNGNETRAPRYITALLREDIRAEDYQKVVESLKSSNCVIEVF